MPVSTHIVTGTDEVPRISGKGASRFARIVETIEDLGGIEAVHSVEIWARAGDRPGRFGQTGIHIEILDPKEARLEDGKLPGGVATNTVSTLNTPEELADQIFEAAHAYEDSNGRHVFQARIFGRKPDGACGTYVPAVFSVLDDVHMPDQSFDQLHRGLESVTRTMRSLERTTTAILAMYRDHAKDAQPSAEWAKVQVELARLQMEQRDHEMMFTILDKRLEQTIREVAPGFAANVAAEPLQHDYPDRIRAWREDLTADELAAFEVAVGQDVADLVRAAGDAATNVDARACVQRCNDTMKVLDAQKYQALLAAIRAAMSPEKARMLGRLLERA